MFFKKYKKEDTMLDFFADWYRNLNEPIQKVIFSDNRTIVLWNDRN